MNISAWSIRNPVPAVLLFLLLSLLGLVSFKRMIVQEYPDVELPVVVITSVLPGASPTQLENSVARKIEAAAGNIPAVRHVYTSIDHGVVTTLAEFQINTDLADVSNELRDMLNRLRSEMPAELKEQFLTRVNTSGKPVLTYVATSDRLSEAELSWWVDHKIAKSLRTIKGVGDISRVGGVEREIQVEIDPARLAAFDISAAEISRQIERVQQETSGGEVAIGGAKQSVRIVGTVRTAEQIGAMDITLSGGRRVRLDQLATVADTFAERNSKALLNGKPVAALEITRARGASEIELAAAVRNAVAELNKGSPGVVLTEAFNGVDAVSDAYAGSMQLLYEGALLAVLVVWLFLRDWRATGISVIALPLSIIPTFAVIHALGFSLNIVTLQSLALVVGILVDDAIVEVENIVRHLRMGKTPWQASMDAVDEIGLAVVATTFTLVAVFLPTIFMGGVTGKFFLQFGWTASVAVVASLVVARILTPVMAAYFLRPVVQKAQDGRLLRVYLRAAEFCLTHRKTTMGAALGIFILSLALIPLLPTGFIPQADHNQTLVSLELPPGSDLEDTIQVAEHTRALLGGHPDIVQTYAAVGEGYSGGNMFSSSGLAQIRKATLTVNLTRRQDRAQDLAEIEEEIRHRLKALPGVRTQVGSGGMGERLTLMLSGEDAALLSQTARQLVRELRSVTGVSNLTSSDSLVNPQLVISPKFGAAADLGVTTFAIGDTLRIATSGDYEQVLAKLNVDSQQVPIRVRLPETARGDMDVLERLAVAGAQGRVMLGNVADLEMIGGPVQINRYDGRRVVAITLELTGRSFGDVWAEVNALPMLRNLPTGIARVAGGDAEVMEEMYTGFSVAMLTGVLCIYMILVLLFKDFLQPITIIAALPLAIGGAFGALLITQHALSMPSLLGLLMLMGIAVKNSILLVEYTIIARHQYSMSRMEAVFDACRKRVRPIVMTSVAMGAGMLPVAIGIGADPSFRVPMAIVVIGGLITSTLLSLLVIPVFFTYIDDLGNWLKKYRKVDLMSAGVDMDSITRARPPEALSKLH